MYIGPHCSYKFVSECYTNVHLILIFYFIPLFVVKHWTMFEICERKKKRSIRVKRGLTIANVAKYERSQKFCMPCCVVFAHIVHHLWICCWIVENFSWWFCCKIYQHLRVKKKLFVNSKYYLVFTSFLFPQETIYFVPFFLYIFCLLLNIHS